MSQSCQHFGVSLKVFSRFGVHYLSATFRYLWSHQQRRGKSVHAAVTVAQHLTPLGGTTVVNSSTGVLCKSQSINGVNQSTPSCMKTHPVPDEVILKLWCFLIAVILFNCGAKESVQLMVWTIILPSSRATNWTKLHWSVWWSKDCQLLFTCISIWIAQKASVRDKLRFPYHEEG